MDVTKIGERELGYEHGNRKNETGSKNWNPRRALLKFSNFISNILSFVSIFHFPVLGAC